MSVSLRGVLFVTVSVGCLPAAQGQEPPDGKARVEFRWLESRPVEGVTETEGFQATCDPDSIVYPHVEPALLLTAEHVEQARLTVHDLRTNGLRVFYNVALHLTQEAREELAASCEGDEARMLTVAVDGKYWGVHRYEKDRDKPFVPEVARAESFTPGVGFFSSRTEAERLVAAFE